MPSRRRPSRLPILLLGFLVVGLALGGVYWYGESRYQSLLSEKTPGGSTPHLITVVKGTSIGAIAGQLQTKNLIPATDAFLRFAREKGDDQKIQAGTFSVTGGLTIPEVLDILTGRTKPARARVIIREGLTIREIADQLTREGRISSPEEFTSCIAETCDFSSFTFLPSKTNPAYAFPHSYMEGYLFPDTYFIETDTFTVESFIRQMLQTFDTKVRKGLAKEIAASSYSLQEIIIMASIVEKESRPPDDQSVVAGILWKRLENGVQLAADATNRYIKENPLDPIYQAELVSSNPYNGRKVKGLPPSAISSPGLASLRAALSPTTSDWWYYLHDNNGVIRFARTELEHNQNKSLYLR